MSGHVDVRCPVNPSQLFARLLLDSQGRVDAIEVSCRDCRRKGKPHMHRYTPDGLPLQPCPEEAPR